MEQAIQQLSQMISEAGDIVFFGGAGVSTASGIPDFRSAHGIYSGAQGRSYEEMLSHGYFMRHEDVFWAFYKNVMLYPDAQPNAAHRALKRLEEQGKLSAILTQNIDGLHQLAGSSRVYELHGTVHRNYCMRCGEMVDLAYVAEAEGTPKCPVCGQRLKPDVVLYGENLDDDVVADALAAIRKCDLLIVGGTSLVVQPAAGMIMYRRPSCKLALINRDETPYDDHADLVIHHDLGAVLDAVIPGC
ncbi:MAG: NAD-dependent protein deacylase [Clostridia bacterium]|nr:NAD-dependent protein deacylase [Clostridia bacterium]